MGSADRHEGNGDDPRRARVFGGCSRREGGRRTPGKGTGKRVRFFFEKFSPRGVPHSAVSVLGEQTVSPRGANRTGLNIIWSPLPGASRCLWPACEITVAWGSLTRRLGIYVGIYVGLCLFERFLGRFTVVFTVVFCVISAGGPSRGRPLRLAVQFCTPPRGGSEPQRLEKSARSGSPHVAAALTLARPGGLRLRWLGAPRSRERKTSCRLRLRCQSSWTNAG